jgi:metal-responsive CopG/Arc/MetJ family transcriptional regulator
MGDSFKKKLLKGSHTELKSKLVGVRLPTDLVEELTILSKKSGKSFSRVIIEALRHALEIPEKKRDI